MCIYNLVVKILLNYVLSDKLYPNQNQENANILQRWIRVPTMQI